MLPPISVTNKKKIFVGLSGGVDSAVSAALLKEQGYDVVGVFIKVWTPDFVPCTWREERRDAMRVAAHLGIPFLFFDFEDEYKRAVADYMIEEYKRGRTPNPDVLCNRAIKFGAFWHQAEAMGADAIATGHYARILPGPNLGEGTDKNKDQSYFLWMLTPDDLSHILFPIGHLHKDQVRELARRFGLPVAEKKDSQGICFIGEVEMEEFLSHFVESKPGPVLDTEGRRIGTHRGVIYYTIGERHGFDIAATESQTKPHYVVSKETETNTIIVAAEEQDILGVSPRHIRLANINWIGAPIPNIEVRIRYRGERLHASISGNELWFEAPVRGLAMGQSIVFYHGDECLGGAIADAIIA